MGATFFFNHFYYEPGYDPRNEIEEERARKFGNSLMRKPEIYICDLDQKTILKESESKADVKKYIAWNYQTNKECLFDLANKAYNELRSKGDDKLYEVARAHEDSLSDIGFFMFDNHIHVVTLRPFFRTHYWGEAGWEYPGYLQPEITVDKLIYNQVPKYFVREQVCSYHVDGGL